MIPSPAPSPAASAVPAFTIESDVQELSLSTDAIEDFNMYGQLGFGVDFSVLFLEAGYNFGFEDLISTGITSVPNQVYINFGFRL